MAVLKTHPKEDLIRYLDGGIAGEEKRRLEEHLEACADCRELLSFAKDFNEGLREVTAKDFKIEDPCPDSMTLVLCEARELDEETTKHVRAHLLFCDTCSEKYYALRRSTAAEKQSLWQELLNSTKDFVVELGKSYGPGALVGSIRIVAEQPAFAVRGGGNVSSKILEVSVGDNAYSIELTVSGLASVSCDIAGFRVPVKEPLGVSVHTESGEEIVSTKSDNAGNCHFAIPAILEPNDLCILILDLKGTERHLVFRLPE